MIYSVRPGQRTGEVLIPASKSYAHRLIICAALSNIKTDIICDGISKDIEATIKCLNGLGANIKIEDKNNLVINPVSRLNNELSHLYCGESGSTLRFLIPVVGALGVKAVFHMEGKLSQRPLDELIKTLSDNGMTISRENNLLYCNGKLNAGNFEIPGNISSQYISGLLFALPLLDGKSTLKITENIESLDYILMTEDVIAKTGIRFTKVNNTYLFDGNQHYKSEGATVERDWSNAAFFMCIGALSDKGVTLNEMNLSSKQGDKEIINILSRFGAQINYKDDKLTVRKGTLTGQIIDAKAIPDLIPVICALACGAEGTTEIINAERLRLKESDRIKTTRNMLSSLGADITETENGLIIHGKGSLIGGEVNAENDHRIAMSAAVAASICNNNVIVNGADCVSKSYPDFWKHFEGLEEEI